MIDQRDLAPYGVFVEELRLPAGLTVEQRVDRRRAAMLALDQRVRRALATVSGGLPAPTIDMTIYDAVYPGTPNAGGHWTAAALTMSLWRHTVSSYTVTLLFDDDDRPSRFVVDAASKVVSTDTSEAALRDALETARARGPLQTSSSHLFASVGL
jgi:hypothetical protein